MNNIEANVSTQVADVQRQPQATQEDVRAHAQVVQQAESTGDAVASAPVDAEEVRSAAAQVQQIVEASSGRQLAFELQGDDHQNLVVQVLDSATDELIKQIPGEDVLKLRERISEVVGLLFEDQA